MVLAGGLLGGNMGGIISMDMLIPIELFYGFLGSMGQLYNALPSSWDHGLC